MVQMPALNTLQFGWCKSRLPRKAQPAPPIFEPEVAARAIYCAAHHPERREYYVGFPTVKAIFGNKLAPSFADRYLARMGYAARQYGGPDDPNRPNNLWDPVAGAHGAHGNFDDRAARQSFEFWAETEHSEWRRNGASNTEEVTGFQLNSTGRPARAMTSAPEGGRARTRRPQVRIFALPSCTVLHLKPSAR